MISVYLFRDYREICFLYCMPLSQEGLFIGGKVRCTSYIDLGKANSRHPRTQHSHRAVPEALVKPALAHEHANSV